jgi:hypothetical protein
MAILQMLSYVHRAVDDGDVADLILFNLSAAGQTVDPETLLRNLKSSFGLTVPFYD